jgi:hypothetical protein
LFCPNQQQSQPTSIYHLPLRLIQIVTLTGVAALPEDQIQTEDLPEVRDWSDARRGVFYRPIEAEITLHLDADIID